MLQEGPSYTIINQDSELALSISDEPNNNSVVGRRPDGSRDQKVRPTMTPLNLTPPLPSDPDPLPQWVVMKEADGVYVFQNVANETFLAVEGELRPGAKVVGSDTPTPWRIETPVGPPDYHWYR